MKIYVLYRWEQDLGDVLGVYSSDRLAKLAAASLETKINVDGEWHDGWPGPFQDAGHYNYHIIEKSLDDAT